MILAMSPQPPRIHFTAAKLPIMLVFACTASLTSDGADLASEALQERVLAVARNVTAEDYAFTRTVRSERVEGGKTTQRTEVERYDPTRPSERRWTLISIDGRPPSADELKRHARSSPKRRVGHYGRVAMYIGSAATTSLDAKGRTVFRFATLPNGVVVLSGNDVSGSATGEATVNTSGAVPFVEEARFTLMKPVRVKVVAKIERCEVISRYRLMPDGKPVPTEYVSDVHGSLLGQPGRIRSALTYGEHRAVER